MTYITQWTHTWNAILWPHVIFLECLLHLRSFGALKLLYTSLISRLPFSSSEKYMGCSADPLRFWWSGGYMCDLSYCHHQIGSIDLSHYCHNFRWPCVCGGYTIIFCHIDPKKAGFGFYYWWRWHSFLCTLHYFNIVNVQTYPKAMSL